MKFLIIIGFALLCAYQTQAASLSNYRNTLLHKEIQFANLQLDELSLLTRYAGMGYNLLDGNPEGSSTLGGLDPGIRTTRFIVDHTYTEGRQAYYKGNILDVPDQVEFQMSDACSSKSRANTFSGETSYKNELALSASVSGGYSGLFEVAFSLSYNMKNTEERTEQSKKVMLQKTKVCNFGRARYKLDSALSGIAGYTLTQDFRSAVKNLPSQYSVSEYVHFLDDWGTHMVGTVDLGTRNMTRSLSTYTQVYSHLMKENSGSVEISGSYGGGNVAASFELSSLQDTVDSNTELGESKETAIVGSVDVPLPISYTELVPITVVMNEAFWGAEWSLVQEKSNSLVQALTDYATNKNAGILPDPSLGIEGVWPDGTFIMVSSANGCPQGFSAGYFSHDAENDNNNLISIVYYMQMSIAFPNSLDISANSDHTTVHYCSKTVEGSTGMPWQQGSYCLARYGDSCLEGFYNGAIKWDDEDDSSTKFAVHQPVPSYGDGNNPTIQYCCRSDGKTSNPLFLPTKDSFGLYRYGGTCQQVYGMKVQEIKFGFDTEDSWGNESSCSGNHPDDLDCQGDHILVYCAYSPCSPPDACI